MWGWVEATFFRGNKFEIYEAIWMRLLVVPWEYLNVAIARIFMNFRSIDSKVKC